LLGVTHDAAMLSPARALGDRELWPKLKELLLEWIEDGDNEESLVPQWNASLRFDQRAALPGVKVPVPSPPSPKTSKPRPRTAKNSRG
jgi:hypothetical protein